jgi:putative spermidine/putrescine transport system permease protein
MRRLTHWYAAPAVLLVCILVVALLIVVRQSFDIWTPTGGQEKGWVLDQYERLFSERLYRGVLVTTLRIGLWTTLIAPFLAYPLALAIARTDRATTRRLLLVVAISPILINLFVLTYGWIIILGPKGLVNQVYFLLGGERPIRLLFSERGMVIGLVHSLLPFMILPVASSLMAVPKSLVEAAGMLGASSLTIFRRIYLPLSLPGLFAGCLLVFTLSISSFVIPLLMGGGLTLMASIAIRDQYNMILNWPFGSALSVVLLAGAGVLLLIYRRIALMTGMERVGY